MAMQASMGLSKIIILVGAGIFVFTHCSSCPYRSVLTFDFDLLIYTYICLYIYVCVYLCIYCTGYTSTILLKNGKLSDVLGELQVLKFSLMFVKLSLKSNFFDGIFHIELLLIDGSFELFLFMLVWFWCCTKAIVGNFWGIYFVVIYLAVACERIRKQWGEWWGWCFWCHF